MLSILLFIMLMNNEFCNKIKKVSNAVMNGVKYFDNTAIMFNVKGFKN